MRNDYKISINQLANYSSKSENGKFGVVKKQLKPSKAVVSLYSKAKKIVALSMISNGNKRLLNEGIEEFKNTYVADTDWKLKNKKGSIAALEKFLTASMPDIFNESIFESIKVSRKNSLIVSDVKIIVSPDVIIKTIIDGQAYYGAIKIHVAKKNIFDREEAKYVTTCLFQYMNDNFGKEGVILPELCLCVDIYGGTIKYAPSETEKTIKSIEEMCNEIKSIWNKLSA
jgi:hypothetical protein